MPSPRPDFAAADRHYPLWHLVAHRGPRRGGRSGSGLGAALAPWRAPWRAPTAIHDPAKVLVDLAGGQPPIHSGRTAKD